MNSSKSIKDKILKLSIEEWQKSSAGISAISISEKLDVGHDSIMSMMEELTLVEKGFMNENVTLYIVKFEFDTMEVDDRDINPKPIKTHVFFPSKSILKKNFEKNSRHFILNGFYTNLLLQGGHQLELIYFDSDVLSKFFNNQEIYNLDDDVTGGIIRLNSEFLKRKTDKEIDDIFFPKIWYGKRMLKDGNTSIAPLLIDLSKLSVKEQSYWRSYEIENPHFSIHDVDFSKFIARAYHGLTTKSDDPIYGLRSLLQKINSSTEFKIFKKMVNPYLSYPHTNTYKEFVDCNSELYKLIGPDNIDIKSLEKIFLEFCNGNPEDLIHQTSKKKLSTLQIFELILKKNNLELYEKFKLNWSVIKNNRIEGDHKIILPVQGEGMFINQFRIICDNTNVILNEIASEFQLLIK